MRKIQMFLVALLLFICAGCGSSGEMQSSPTEGTEQEESLVDDFILKYNESASTPFTDVTEVNITDKESGHYRVEFRLSAYSNSYAKTGYLGDAAVDVISYGYDNSDIRIYADGISLEQAKEIVKTASPILDDELSDSDLQQVLVDMDEKGELNGYYYGKIGILLSGNDGSYDLMLKVE